MHNVNCSVRIVNHFVVIVLKNTDRLIPGTYVVLKLHSENWMLKCKLINPDEQVEQFLYLH